MTRSEIFRNNYKHQKEAAQGESMKSWVKSSPFFTDNNASKKDRDEDVRKLDEDMKQIARSFNERDEEER